MQQTLVPDLENADKKGKKSQKFGYLENKKSFFDETKNNFHSF